MRLRVDSLLPPVRRARGAGEAQTGCARGRDPRLRRRRL